jgi:hypothetical protein
MPLAFDPEGAATRTQALGKNCRVLHASATNSSISGCVSDRQPTPIDKRAEDASIYQMWKDGIHPFLIKIEEIRHQPRSDFALNHGRALSPHPKIPFPAVHHAFQ